MTRKLCILNISTQRHQSKFYILFIDAYSPMMFYHDDINVKSIFLIFNFSCRSCGKKFLIINGVWYQNSPIKFGKNLCNNFIHSFKVEEIVHIVICKSVVLTILSSVWILPCRCSFLFCQPYSDLSISLWTAIEWLKLNSNICSHLLFFCQ